MHFSRETNDIYNEDKEEYNSSGLGNGNYLDEISRDPSKAVPWQQTVEIDDVPPEPTSPPNSSKNPDRAISIVAELKANAALFAAFAYGSLNLPNTLTVSESKVTSVTTSLSISRPLPDSDLIRTFVVLDVCTLCLMISCVAASQLLIYRLTDGSYEEIDDNYDNSGTIQNFENTNGSRKNNNSRDSALGRLVTTYRNEFTVARLTFDLGLVTLLLAVGVRSLAIFDEDIVVPIAIVIGITAVFLAVAYFTTYIEVFRTAENLKGPLYSIPFLSKENEQDDASTDRQNSFVSRIFLPFSLVSVGLGLYFALASGSDVSESNLSRLGPYDVTSGATKLRVVTEKIDSEKSEARALRRQQNAGKQSFNLSKKAKAAAEKQEAEAAKKKAAETEAKKKAEEEAKKKFEEEVKRKADEEAKRKTEEEAKKKAEEEAYKRFEKEARRKAEEEAAAATAAAKAKVEAAMKKAQEEAAKEVVSKDAVIKDATTTISESTTP